MQLDQPDYLDLRDRLDLEDLPDESWVTDRVIAAAAEAERAKRCALHDPVEVQRAFEAWLERGKPLIARVKKIQWEIGDWLREGDSIGGEGNEFLVLPEGRDLIAEVADRCALA